MPTIRTPLAQVLNPVQGQPTQGGLFQSIARGAQNKQTRLSSILQNQQRQQQIDQQKQLQRAANVNQAAITGLNIIKRDPANAETNLRDMIAQRKVVNPSLGITDTTDTDELERVLNEGGVPAAQELFQSSLDAVRSSGVPLPQPTTPDFDKTFTAIGQSGKPEIFLLGAQGPVATGLIAPPRAPLVQVGPGGGQKERVAEFKALFDESKNIDKTLSQFTQVRKIIREGGLGTIGASGRVTRGFQNVVSAIGGFAKNFGLGSDDFDQNSIVANALKGTPLGEQANRNAKVTSLITNLGFAVARAQGNQRITDKDFEAAIRTIGANADNPEQLAGVLDQFGNNLINQFETDVERTGSAFGFTRQQFESLRNIPSKKEFLTPAIAAQKITGIKEITATTKIADLTMDQARQLAKDDPDLLRKILANAKADRAKNGKGSNNGNN